MYHSPHIRSRKYTFHIRQGKVLSTCWCSFTVRTDNVLRRLQDLSSSWRQESQLKLSSCEHNHIPQKWRRGYIFQKNSSHVSQIFQPGTVFFSIQEAQQRAEHSNATIFITENDSTNGWNRGGGWSFFETIVADNKTIPVDAIFLKTETRWNWICHFSTFKTRNVIGKPLSLLTQTSSFVLCSPFFSLTRSKFTWSPIDKRSSFSMRKASFLARSKRLTRSTSILRAVVQRRGRHCENTYP
jgi:hypothetical protein